MRIFNYIQELDAFVPTTEYSNLAQQLGLVEWNPGVWIGRLFTLDNDYGEHWFDNWDEREARSEAATKLGFETHELLIVSPDRFKNDDDGPCNPPDVRKQFWTDVLKSLELSHDLLFAKARQLNKLAKESDPDSYIPDLEQRIHKIKESLGIEGHKL